MGIYNLPSPLPLMVFWNFSCVRLQPSRCLFIKANRQMRTNQAFLASQKNQDSKTALSKSTRNINQEKGDDAGKQLKQEGGI